MKENSSSDCHSFQSMEIESELAQVKDVLLFALC
jgi:hypothetical protein